jgi:hypothetical protein
MGISPPPPNTESRQERDDNVYFAQTSIVATGSLNDQATSFLIREFTLNYVNRIIGDSKIRPDTCFTLFSRGMLPIFNFRNPP